MFFQTFLSFIRCNLTQSWGQPVESEISDPTSCTSTSTWNYFNKQFINWFLDWVNSSNYDSPNWRSVIILFFCKYLKLWKSLFGGLLVVYVLSFLDLSQIWLVVQMSQKNYKMDKFQISDWKVRIIIFYNGIGIG